MPPRIAISELAMSLTCSEQNFQATNAADLATTLGEMDPTLENVRNASVRDLVEILCCENDTGERLEHLAGLTTLNLFTLIMGK